MSRLVLQPVDVVVPELRTEARLRDMETRVASSEARVGRTSAFSLSAAGNFSIPVSATDVLISIRFSLLLSNGSGDIRVYPNNDSSVAYSQAIDRYTNNQGTAARGDFVGYNNNNGLYLSYRSGGGGGALKVVGSGEVDVATGALRLCRAQAAVSSTTGSGNQTVENQDLSSVWHNTSTAVTYLYVVATSSTLTGSVFVTTY